MLHQVGDDDGGRAGHPRLAVDEQPLPTQVSFLWNEGEKQEVQGRGWFYAWVSDGPSLVAKW